MKSTLHSQPDLLGNVSLKAALPIYDPLSKTAHNKSVEDFNKVGREGTILQDQRVHFHKGPTLNRYIGKYNTPELKSQEQPSTRTPNAQKIQCHL